jgi:hypothetical protein
VVQRAQRELPRQRPARDRADTGFTGILPTGTGLLAFRSPEEAVAAVHEVVGDYARHSRAAREIAAEYFDARDVLGDLLGRVLG